MLTATGEQDTGGARFFADHHERIEAECNALRACANTEDSFELLARYRAFERAVLEHLQYEETGLLPGYEKYAPADAAAIRDVHDDLRRQLFKIGVEVELHCVRGETLDRIIATLRAHAAREEYGLYAWAEANLLLTKRAW